MRVLLYLILCWVPLTCWAPNVTLAWDPSISPEVAGYRLYWGYKSGIYTNHVDAGMVTNYTISNLLSQATYYFAATAYDSNKLESDFSNEAVYTTTNKPPTATLQIVIPVSTNNIK